MLDLDFGLIRAAPRFDPSANDVPAREDILDNTETFASH